MLLDGGLDIVRVDAVPPRHPFRGADPLRVATAHAAASTAAWPPTPPLAVPPRKLHPASEFAPVVAVSVLFGRGRHSAYHSLCDVPVVLLR